MRSVFDNEFQGMTDLPVHYEELMNVREQLVSTIVKELTTQERQFLVSMKQGEPQWGLLGLNGIDRLPALQWKLINIRKMSKNKKESSIAKLKEVLELS
jgi:hypothetical protein